MELSSEMRLCIGRTTLVYNIINKSALCVVDVSDKNRVVELIHRIHVFV